MFGTIKDSCPQVQTEVINNSYSDTSPILDIMAFGYLTNNSSLYGQA